jgi:hypothetical protein
MPLAGGAPAPEQARFVLSACPTPIPYSHVNARPRRRRTRSRPRLAVAPPAAGGSSRLASPRRAAPPPPASRHLDPARVTEFAFTISCCVTCVI